MRPQRNAGENPRLFVIGFRVRARFNEAPAKCRGKQHADICVELDGNGFNEAPAKCRGKQPELMSQPKKERTASMRPQRNAGENLAGVRTRHSCAWSFNEAPAKCRGKLPFCYPKLPLHLPLQ